MNVLLDNENIHTLTPIYSCSKPRTIRNMHQCDVCGHLFESSNWWKHSHPTYRAIGSLEHGEYPSKPYWGQSRGQNIGT